MASDIEQILNRLRDNYDDISKQAADVAVEKLRKDIENEIQTCVEEYYKFKPDMYKKRKKALKRVMSPIIDKNGDVYEVGVQGDESVLKGVHESNSRKHKSGKVWKSVVNKTFAEVGKKNGIPEAEWIYNRFMNAEHPDGRDGFKEQGYNIKAYMDNFFTEKEIGGKLGDYYSHAVANEILKYLK